MYGCDYCNSIIVPEGNRVNKYLLHVPNGMFSLAAAECHVNMTEKGKKEKRQTDKERAR